MSWVRNGFVFALLALAVTARAATITQSLAPAQVQVGQPAVLTLTVRDGGASGQHPGGSIFGITLPTVDVAVPEIDGVQTARTGMSISVGNGTATTTLRYALIPQQTGTFTIPDFDVHTRSGEALHVKAMTLVATGGGTLGVADATVVPATDAAPAPHSGGPVVMPAQNPTPANAPPTIPESAADSGPPEPQAPRDPDGGPAKVFIIITPQTTTAYVGQAVPMEIDFYIRMSVNSDQNSLPTIKGSDFLMNSFTTRGHITIGLLESQQYMRETWVTSIAAPKAGDFPLSMERDTYWVKTPPADDNSIFGGLFSQRANLAHEMIGSNLLTMHILPLPDKGRPDNFTGAIGQFKVTGDAQPASVAVGDPVHLRFEISGEGNFDYVRSPALQPDPAWKPYFPMSKTTYVDESHAHAMKVFDQSIIPQKGGVLPLPETSFSYFDPEAKQYVTVPLNLPSIVVTGSAETPAPAPTVAGGDSAAVTPDLVGLLPNRVLAGAARVDIAPAFRHAWFWGVQVGLVALPLVAAALALWQMRSARAHAARDAAAARSHSLRQEQATMADAARRGDARAFFLAARHAVQLQLGARWGVAPEALTLREIAARDAQLAESVAPLFRQADEVIYSAHAPAGIDLAQWEQRVRTELLQPQPA